MTIDLIIQLIASLTGTGGLIALFLITEKKTAAQLQNTRKMDEKWQQIIAQKERDFALLSDKYEAATAKIERLYDDNSELRNSLDQVNTDCAVSRDNALRLHRLHIPQASFRNIRQPDTAEP